MKKIPLILFLAFMVSACDTWGVPPQPFPVWTPIPSRTPGIVTATPLILLPPTFPTVITETPTTGVILITPSPFSTEIPSPTFTLMPVTPSMTVTSAPIQMVSVDILGCNSSLDNGEVLNAFVTVKNTGTLDLPLPCALLRTSDEGGDHPDRKKCVDNLPAQHRVTLKLTVNSAYKQSTLIQVDVSSNEILLLRVDSPSCADISFSGGEPPEIGVVIPIQP